MKTNDSAGEPISKRLQFYVGEVRSDSEVISSSSEVEVLDDASARLTVHNVSRDMSGCHVTCAVVEETRKVSAGVDVRVAGTLRPVLSGVNTVHGGPA